MGRTKTDDVSERIWKEIGARVRVGREEHAESLTQAELAARAGVSRGTIARIEAGTSPVSLVTLCRLGRALSRDPRDLLPDLAALAEPTLQEGEVNSLLEKRGVRTSEHPAR